jgi:WD40 repeat protein
MGYFLKEGAVPIVTAMPDGMPSISSGTRITTALSDPTDIAYVPNGQDSTLALLNSDDIVLSGRIDASRNFIVQSTMGKLSIGAPITGPTISDGAYISNYVGWTDNEQPGVKILSSLPICKEICAIGDDRIAGIDTENKIIVCDANTGETVSILDGAIAIARGGHAGMVNSICFLGTNNVGGYTDVIASGGDDSTIRLWDSLFINGCLLVLDNRNAGFLGAHTGAVKSVCALGWNQLISGSSDTTVRIWNADYVKTCMLVLRGHTGTVNSVCAVGGKAAVAINAAAEYVDTQSKSGFDRLTVLGFTSTEINTIRSNFPEASNNEEAWINAQGDDSHFVKQYGPGSGIYGQKFGMAISNIKTAALDVITTYTNYYNAVQEYNKVIKDGEYVFVYAGGINVDLPQPPSVAEMSAAEDRRRNNAPYNPNTGNITIGIIFGTILLGITGSSAALRGVLVAVQIIGLAAGAAVKALIASATTTLASAVSAASQSVTLAVGEGTLGAAGAVLVVAASIAIPVASSILEKKIRDAYANAAKWSIAIGPALLNYSASRGKSLVYDAQMSIPQSRSAGLRAALGMGPTNFTVASGSEDNTIRVWDVDMTLAKQVLSANQTLEDAKALRDKINNVLNKYPLPSQSKLAYDYANLIRNNNPWNVAVVLYLFYVKMVFVRSVIILSSLGDMPRARSVKSLNEAYWYITRFNDATSDYVKTRNQTVVDADRDADVIYLDLSNNPTTPDMLYQHVAVACFNNANTINSMDLSDSGRNLLNTGGSLVDANRLMDKLYEFTQAYSFVLNIVTPQMESDARIANAQTPGVCRRVLTGHTGPVTSVTPLSDGRLVSGSRDGTVRIWDSNTGACLRTITVSAPVSNVCVPDSQHIIAKYYDVIAVFDMAGNRIVTKNVVVDNTELSKEDAIYISATRKVREVAARGKQQNNDPAFAQQFISGSTEIYDSVPADSAIASVWTAYVNSVTSAKTSALTNPRFTSTVTYVNFNELIEWANAAANSLIRYHELTNNSRLYTDFNKGICALDNGRVAAGNNILWPINSGGPGVYSVRKKTYTCQVSPSQNSSTGTLLCTTTDGRQGVVKGSISGTTLTMTQNLFGPYGTDMSGATIVAIPTRHVFIATKDVFYYQSGPSTATAKYVEKIDAPSDIIIKYESFIAYSDNFSMNLRLEQHPSPKRTGLFPSLDSFDSWWPTTVNGTNLARAIPKVSSYTDRIAALPPYTFMINSSLQTVKIVDTYPGPYSFAGCVSLTSVVLGDSVNVIGKCAFKNCSLLTSVIYDPPPTSIPRIDADAFKGCISLTSVRLTDSASLVQIEDGMFAMMISAAAYQAAKTANPTLFDGVDCVIDPNTNTLLDMGGNITSFNSTRVSSIHPDCSYPSSLWYIVCNGTLLYANKNAPGFTYTLTEPPPLDWATIYVLIDDLFLGPGDLLIGNNVGGDTIDIAAKNAKLARVNSIRIRGIAERAFDGNNGLKRVILDTNVTTIGAYAFAGSTITTINIPSSVTMIGECAFSNCLSLAGNVNIASTSVSGWGNAIFAGCPYLNKLTFTGATSYPNYQSLFTDTSTGVTGVGKRNACVVQTGATLQYCGPDIHVFPPAGIDASTITTISPTCFANCKSLTSVTFANLVGTSIGVFSVTTTAKSYWGTITDVTVDSQNNIYMLNTAYPTTVGGSFIYSIYKVSGESASLIISSFNVQMTPAGIAVDPNNNLYIVDAGGKNVRAVEYNGSAWVLGRSWSASFDTPIKMAFDHSGAMYVLDSSNKNVTRWNNINNGQPEMFTSGFTNPNDVAIDSNGNAYVADSDGIWKITPAKEKSKFKTMGPCFSISVDVLGNIYVVSGNSLSVFAPNGDDISSSLHSRISAPVNMPRAVAIGGDGYFAAVACAGASVSDPNIIRSFFTYPADPTRLTISSDCTSLGKIELNASSTITNFSSIEALPKAYVVKGTTLVNVSDVATSIRTNDYIGGYASNAFTPAV